MTDSKLWALSAGILALTAGMAAAAWRLTKPPYTATAIEFKEPGSGLWMPLEADVWYLLSDSGSAYSPHGFPSWEHAKEYAQTALEVHRDDISVPMWRPATSDWNDDWSVCNVLCSSCLYAFWRTTDADMLEYR